MHTDGSPRAPYSRLDHPGRVTPSGEDDIPRLSRPMNTITVPRTIEAMTMDHVHHHMSNPLRTSAHATHHCLTGCVIGEVAGLMIGVTLGWGVWSTIALATTLAYISGFVLGLVPLVKQGKTFAQAFRLIWIGEAISIGVMEVAMNAVDYAVGGMEAGSIFEPIFWLGIAVAVPAGFLVAWPVNWWLIARDLKACH